MVRVASPSDQEQEPEHDRSGSVQARRASGADWLSVALLSVLFVILIASSQIDLKSVGTALAALVIPLLAVVTTTASARRIWQSSEYRARRDRLRILEEVLHDSSADAAMKRRALDAVIADNAASQSLARDFRGAAPRPRRLQRPPEGQQGD